MSYCKIIAPANFVGAFEIEVAGSIVAHIEKMHWREGWILRMDGHPATTCDTLDEAESRVEFRTSPAFATLRGEK